MRKPSRSSARSELLDPTDRNVLMGRAFAQLLREDWTAAREAAGTLSSSPDETRKWFGAMAQFVDQRLHGTSSRRARRGPTVPSPPTKSPAPAVRSSRRLAASLLLAGGQVPPALAQIQKSPGRDQGLGRRAEQSGSAQRSSMRRPVVPKRLRRRLRPSRHYPIR